MDSLTNNEMSSPLQPSDQPKGLFLRPLAPFEDRLLNALAFFRTQRKVTTQAHHCLSMYLRQSESRVMSEVGWYAQRVGMDKYELLELIYNDPDKAQELIERATGTNVNEVFEAE